MIYFRSLIVGTRNHINALAHALKKSTTASSTYCFSTCFQNVINIAVPFLFVGLEKLEPPLFEVKEGIGIVENKVISL